MYLRKIKHNINSFKERESVVLTKEKIKKNSVLRSLAKLQLNSFWEKFGQRNNLSQTTFLKSKEELNKLVTNPRIDVTDLESITDDIMLGNWKYLDELISLSPFTRIVIASYVAAIARLKLYPYLELFGE